MSLTEKELLYATQIAYYDFDQGLIDELTVQNDGVSPTLQDILNEDRIRFREDDPSNPSTIYGKFVKTRVDALENHGEGSLQEIRAQTALGRYDEMQNGEICAGWEIVDIRDENNTTGMVACLIETDDENALVAFRGSESNTSSNSVLHGVLPFAFYDDERGRERYNFNTQAVLIVNGPLKGQIWRAKKYTLCPGEEDTTFFSWIIDMLEGYIA